MVDILFVNLPRLPQIGEEFWTTRYAIDVGGGGVIMAIAPSHGGARPPVESGFNRVW
jgi:hypothetical protein